MRKIRSRAFLALFLLLYSDHFAGPAVDHRRVSKLHSAEIRIDSRQNGAPGPEQQALNMCRHETINL